MTDLFNAGFQLMLAGMTAVFILLSLLVLAVQRMSRLAQFLERRYLIPAIETTSGSSAVAASTAQSKALEEELVTAISAAVHRYRRSHRKP